MAGHNIGKLRRGFTLVELLVVIAITAVLLGLLLVPLVQGFRYTRQGQVQAQAQTTTRFALERIQNDLKRAAYVFDTSNRTVTLWVTGRNNQPVAVPLRNAIIDLVPPAYGDPSQESNDPTSDIPIGPRGEPDAELAVPVSPGRTVVRYFIGLQDNTDNNNDGIPDTPYLNPEEQPMTAATDRENLAVLYRAEFRLYVQDQDGRWRLNPELFDTIADFYDPNFFYGRKWRGWRRVAKPIVPVGQVDMINLTYDQNGNPRVTPLLQFKPAQVVNQAGAPIETQTLSDEMGAIVPIQIKFPHGLWTLNPDVFRLWLFRSAPDALQRNQPLVYFYTLYDDALNQWFLCYYRYDPTTRQEIDGVRVCNLTLFRQALLNGQPTTDWFTLSDPNQAEAMAFYLNEEAGQLEFAIPWWMGYPHAVRTSGLVFSTGRFETPQSDPNPDRVTINGRYNYQYRLDPQNINNVKRYISLIDLDSNGQVDNPLLNHLVLPNASIVAGSEVVIGPDQRPGPNYGKPIKYQRVASATRDVGPNQYRILYRDATPMQEVLTHFGFEPSLLRGYIEFYSDPNTPLPPGQDNVVVTFHYQFNLPSDSAVVDYETRRVMALQVGMKFYGAERPVNYALNTQIELPNIVQLRGQ
ncbi:MAG: prepilin-type N-terminal cleavage/methylation domain-containing protein [Armatimonadota bacterium]